MEIDWKEISEPWLFAEAGLESAHRSVLERLLQRAGLKEGQHVIDIGCGTGASLLAASTLVGAEGRVTGVDIAPPLVARAQQRVPSNVEVIVGDAGAFQHKHTYDAAISLFGTMFFSDTKAAFSSIRRTVSPGARFVFSAWGPPTENPWFGVPRASVEAQVGQLPKPDPNAPGPFRFADPEGTIQVIQSAGWHVDVETESLTLHTGQDSEGLADMHLVLSEALMLKNRGVSDSDRSSIWKNLRDGFEPFAAENEVKVPAEVHFFTATQTTGN